MERINEHTCNEPECGHYTWAHTHTLKPGGCLVIVENGNCCGCIKQYPDGVTNLSDPDVTRKLNSLTEHHIIK
jgi:hypothetical protein